MKQLKLKRSRSKMAVSAVIGAVLMIGVTIAIGFAVWAWARGAATYSEDGYNNMVGSNVNYLRENFAIVNANFSSTGQTITVWFYNPGNVTVYIKQIWISNATGSSTTFTTTSTSSTTTTTRTISTGTWTNSTDISAVKSSCGYCIKVPVGVVSLNLVTFGTVGKFTVGSTYTITAVGQYGNTNNYQTTR